MKKRFFSWGMLCQVLAIIVLMSSESCKKGDKAKDETVQEAGSKAGKGNSATTLAKGAIGTHDPSTIAPEGSRFYQFSTGRGINMISSSDLISWSNSGTVFTPGTWPSWISSAVPGFAGDFWAPDIIRLNNKWYLYYSCSTFGSSRSAIGLATSTSITGPWTDMGMVVSSTTNSNINAIDPGLFRDTDGRVYMTYGSYFGGIGIIELDPISGKVKSGSSVVRVAGGGSYEAPYLIKEGSYYYLFINRGSCCKGVESSYWIIVGRSTSPIGPFTDFRTVLERSGRYIGPGHVSLLRHNGANFAPIHFYDGNDGGRSKLDILKMGFSDGWPYLTRDWIASGTHSISNVHSGKVWDAWGCTGVQGQAIAQGTWSNANCQKWNFTPVGDGAYRLISLQGGRSADVIGCNAANGAKLNVWDWLNNNCQKFRIDRAATGSYVFTPLNSDRVVEVPGALLTDGVQLALYNYNGHNCQKWNITPR